MTPGSSVWKRCIIRCVIEHTLSVRERKSSKIAHIYVYVFPFFLIHDDDIKSYAKDKVFLMKTERIDVF